jgi:DNA-binding LytR/AlgR family response regulator
MSNNEPWPEIRNGIKPNAAAKILLIDDDESFNLALGRVLRKHKYDVTTINSGKEGIRLAAVLLPDVVVCDLDMPGMDGYEVLANLRKDARLSDIPFVFLTGHPAPEQMRKGMNLGADDYLNKPVGLNNLLHSIEARLTRAHAGRVHQQKQMEHAMQLFASVVHDLRDPLFVIFGYTNILKEGETPVPRSEERSEEILDRMQEAIGRMQMIVSETLFLAKSKMKRLPFDASRFDLRVLCEDLIADQNSGDRITFHCAEKECAIVGDPLRLRQALENVLANALKYSDHVVVVTVEKLKPGYRIEVKDHGIGIPEAERNCVFEPFFRGSNTGGKSGHGLGLSIVKTCVEQYAGKIEFTSAVGEGTSFRIELPDAPDAAQPLAVGQLTAIPLPMLKSDGRESEPDSTSEKGVPAGAAAAASGKLKGIIIDDDPLVRDILRDLLTNSGDVSVVGEAGSVAQSRQLVAQLNPDVVFLDINLPDASGLELLPLLGPGTLVVFVTSSEEYAVNAFDSDAVDFLLKPVTRERLQRALKRLRQRAAAPAPQRAGARLSLDDTFLVKTMSEKKLILVREVTSVIAYGEYSWVYWDKGKGALLRKGLKQWESELPEGEFVRIHRNAIVNLAFMERLERLPSGRLQVHLRGSTEPISVSLRLAPSLNRKLKKFKP